jgi:peptidyl-prolyl cis-trans isomerase A (cyclophilin A)
MMMRLTVLSLAIVGLFLAVGTGLAGAPGAAQPNRDKLMNPDQLKEAAPAKFQVKFETSKGDIVVEVTRDWSPNGADRFYNLVKNGYYDGCRFFRVIENFMVQFGISGDPKINAALNKATIVDDKVKQSNLRGYITYAKSSMPNSRTTQVFINFKDNAFLDNQGFSPFGKVIKGMDIVDSLYSKYGEGPPSGQGPEQGRVQAEGNAYLEKSFPKLDYVKAATIVAGPAK